MQITDADLTGYIDGELPADQMVAMHEALANDPDASARLETLKAATLGLSKNADALLTMAPKMPELPAMAPTRQPTFGIIGTAAAACVMATAFILTRPADQDWMTEVARYQALYVTETLANAPEQPPEVIATISDRIGRPLIAATTVEGLDYRRSQLLGVDGNDLVQMAFLDANGAPFALCLIRGTGDTDPLDITTRAGLASASWSDGQHAYILIGGTDLTTVETLAKSFQAAL